MTKAQINYIVETVLDDVTDSDTYLENCKYIIASKQDMIIPGSDKKLYFDTDNELLVVTDLDSDGNVLVKSNVISRVFYSFDSILLFVMNTDKKEED